MRFLAAATVLFLAPTWATEWSRIHSEHFELVTDAKEKEARAFLNSLEQYRHAVAVTLGQKTLAFQPPARVFLFGTTTEAQQYQQKPFLVTADRTLFVFAIQQGFSRDIRRLLAQRLIEANLGRMPAGLEAGLLDYLSNIRIDRTRITAGEAPAPAERTPDWARTHLLAVHPDFYGRLPVLLRNLARGIAEDAAYRNSVGVEKAEVERRVQQYLSAGRFETTPISGLPIDPERDWASRPTEQAQVDQLLGEIVEARRRAAEYEKALADAVVMKDNAFAMASLRRAIELEPLNPRAYLLLAQREGDAKKRTELLDKAVQLDRRNPEAWNALAQAYLDNRQYGEAAKAWISAEQAATSESQRGAFRKSRLDIERQRLEYEEAERRRIADEKERELRILKEKAIAEIRAAEARANKGNAPRDPNEKVVPWWEGPQAEGTAKGTLVRIDCLGQKARLHIQTEKGALLKLLIKDPSQILIRGKGELTLGCGAQKKRLIAVEYSPKPDSATGTAGEVAAIEFPE